MAAPAEPLTLGDLSEVLLHRWRSALAGSLFAGVVLAILAFGRAPTYQATASMVLDRSQRSLAARLDPASAPVADDLVSTQRELLLSKEVLEQAQASVGGGGPAYRDAKDPVDLLRRRLRVVAVREAWIVTLALSDEDPHRAERLLAAILDAYRDVHLRRGRVQDKIRQEALRRQVESARQELTVAEDEVTAFRAQHGIVSSHPQDNHLAQEINQLSRQRSESEGRLAEVSARAEQVQAAMAEPDPVERRRRLLSLSAIAQQRAVVELSPRVVAAVSERDRLAEKYLEKHPRLIQVVTEAASLDRQYQAVIEAAAAGVLASAQEVAESHRLVIARLADVQARATAYGEALLHLARREERRATLEKVHRDLSERYHLQAAAARIEDVPLAIADVPAADRTAQGLSRMSWMVVLLAGASVAGIGAAFLREVFDGRVRDRGDIQRRHGLATLVELPLGDLVSAESAEDLPVIEPETAETLRGLRATLPLGDSGGRVFLVTSPGGGDGRTSLATGLALVLADAGVRVLLVDADLRMPSLDVVFAQPSAPGLVQVLAGDAEISPRPTPHPNLHLMPAGGTPANPAELLAGHCLREWLDFCRSNYQVVVIDGAPADVADAIEVARASDALVLAMRAGWTRHQDTTAALGRLASFRPRLLGAVLLPAA